MEKSHTDDPSARAHRRMLFLEELATLASELINVTKMPDLFQAICNKLQHLTDASNVYIATVSDDRQYFDIKYFSATSALLVQKRFSCDQGVGGQALLKNRFVIAEDYSNYPRVLKLVDNIVSVCSVPIRRDGKAVGVLTLIFTQPGKSKQLERDLLQTYADVASVALENTARYQQQLQERDLQLALLEINTYIHKSSSLDEIFGSVCRRIVTGFGAARVWLYRHEDKQYKELSSLQLRNGTIKEETTTSNNLLKESACQWAIETMQPTVLYQDTKHPEESERSTAYRTENNFGCSFLIPIIVSGVSWGILCVHRDRGEPVFQGFEIKLLELLGSQLSVAIDRHQLVANIEYEATHDVLTGLPNRSRLNSRISALAKNNNHGIPVTLFYIDLDGFKAINDEYGHSSGDMLLESASRRMESVVPADIELFRVGGDEFAAIYSGDMSDAEAHALGIKLVDVLEREFDLKHAKVSLSGSIGIANTPQHTNNAEELLALADIAMYQAKRSSSGEVVTYEEEVGRRYKRSVEIKSRLKHVIGNQELELLFQPKVSCHTWQVDSVEALVRWNHPKFGTISPIEWIPLAEQTGAIERVGLHIFEMACQSLKQFNALGLNLKIAVNISTRQFEADNFAETIVEAARAHQINPERIELEVTESVLAKNINNVASKLAYLNQQGFRIAIDDFGTGYSSLGYLQQLEMHVLKIDRTFVKQMQPGMDQSLVQTVVSVAKSMNLDTVAEGVETSSQLEQVAALGADYIQGYYFSKPVSGSELPDVIAEVEKKAAEYRVIDKAA